MSNCPAILLPLSPSSKLPHLQPSDRDPRRYEKHRASCTAQPRENNRILELAVAVGDDPPSKWRARQRRNGRDGENGASADANIFDG